MKATIVKTKNQAIKQAKKELAVHCGVSKINSKTLIRHTSTRCCCGETSAIGVWSLKYNKEAVVGYCNGCYGN